MYLRLGDIRLDLDRPRVMGILNVTPDSFSDGGQYTDLHDATSHALRMVDAGAAIVDVGGESSRPGAAEISEQAEIERVVPVIEALRESVDIPISVDTSKPAVMAAAAAAGATMVNDVYALRREGALEAAARLELSVCLMHMQGEPATMQEAPQYGDVAQEVAEFLEQRVVQCKAAGIAEDRVCIDPGFGFGKTDQHNLALLRKLPTLQRLGLPILVGLSRKRTLGTVTGKAAGDRLAAGIAAATYATLQGASLVRTHDVAETVDAMKIIHAIQDR